MGRRLVIAVLAVCACTGRIGDAVYLDGDTASGADGQLVPSGLRLLTPTQYRNSVRDLLGADVPVEPVGQWRSSVAAAQGGVSAGGVEQYEEAALAASAFVFGQIDRRGQLVGCEPERYAGDACTRDFVAAFGRRAWRRALTEDEIARWSQAAADVAAIYDGDPWRGLELAVAGMLQSPAFLYRAELGEPDPDDPRRVKLTSDEMATRLAYLVWNSTPDDALLDAAQRDELATAAGVQAAADRLFESERARAGLLQLYTDWLDLDALATLDKDPALLPRFSPTLGPALREQMLRTIEGVVFGPGGDVRDLFDTRDTFVNGELAALYGLGTMGLEPGDGFVPVTLPEDGPRAGILTLGALLAIHAGEAETSPTLRGKFVRNVLLCQDIPPPPADVVTVIPEPAPDELVTKRDLLERHRTDPSCSGCHQFMDPIGLALENFDAIGGFRDTQNGLPIDPTGDLDGVAFADARDLGRALRDHPAVADCFVRTLYRYAVAHVENETEEVVLGDVTERFVAGGYGLRAAIDGVVTSDGFRFAGRADDAESEPSP